MGVVLALALLATFFVMAVLVFALGVSTAVSPLLEDRSAHTSTLRPLFVVGTPAGIVLDGLLDVGTSTIGVPTTWTLVAPQDPVLRHLVLCALQEWADEDADVDVDVGRLDDRPRSIGLDHDGSHIRLAVLSPGRC